MELSNEAKEFLFLMVEVTRPKNTSAARGFAPAPAPRGYSQRANEVPVQNINLDSVIEIAQVLKKHKDFEVALEYLSVYNTPVRKYIGKSHAFKFTLTDFYDDTAEYTNIRLMDGAFIIDGGPTTKSYLAEMGSVDSANAGFPASIKFTSDGMLTLFGEGVAVQLAGSFQPMPGSDSQQAGVAVTNPQY